MKKTLSPREIQVARLVLAGKSRCEIAADLNLAPTTVAVNWHKVMKKTSTKNAIQFSLCPTGLELARLAAAIQPTTTP